MIIQKERFKEIPTYINFHKKEHEILSKYFIEKVFNKIDFKLKIQKASIQLLNAAPFVVLGLRRSEKHIFIEFYNENIIDDKRIVKTLKKDDNVINRVNISTTTDIDKQLVDFVIHSNYLINRN